MVKWFIFCSLFCTIVQAQQVVPLYQTNSLRTYATIPFRLQRTTVDAIPIHTIAIVDGKDDCLGMIDPKIPSNFLLKCLNPVSVSIDVFFETSGVLQKIRYGPLAITKISDTGVIPPSTGATDRYKAGRELYAAKCMQCHSNPYALLNPSFTKIKSTISSQPRMNFLSTLTDDEIREISNYLFHLDSP